MSIIYRVEQKTQVVARRGGQVVWRWQSRYPVRVIGSREGIVIARETLLLFEGRSNARFVGLAASSGKPLWQRILNYVFDEYRFYGRLFEVYQPNSVYATGTHNYVDVRTGRIIHQTSDNLKRETPRELLWYSPPGLPPYSGPELSVTRLDRRSLQKQTLVLPLPALPGIEYDEYPVQRDGVRVGAVHVAAIYTGFRTGSRDSVYFLASYRWAGGNGQKPEIHWLDNPRWPRKQARQTAI